MKMFHYYSQPHQMKLRL